MNAILFIILLAAGLSLVMTLAWQIAIRTGQSGWVDAIWTFATGAAGVVASLAPISDTTPYWPRQLLVAVLAGAWSLRLGLHIVARTRGGGDDPRYANLRKEWGVAWKGRLWWFLQIQAAAALLLALSVMAAARNPAPGFRLADWLGVAILIIAVVGEAISDRQLAAFTANPANRGKVMQSGLWSLSRHPNYFFEWLGWLAYLVIAISLGGYWWGLAALAAPLLMYWLLVHVSGVPPLEEHMLRTRGDAFRAYQARVNAFFPWFNRTNGASS